MRILVTRPEPDASATGQRLEALGHQVTSEPMLQVEFLPIDPVVFAGAQAVIATSRNALRALASSGACDAATALPIYVVGDKTAEEAKRLGFGRVVTGPGRARDLAPVIADDAEPAGGFLVHVAGENLAFDLGEALAERNIDVRQVTAYRTRASEALTPATERALRDGALDAVILMSPRTAATFDRLVDGRGLAAEAGRLTCICISREVADALQTISPIRIEIAQQPDFEGIIDTLSRVARPA
jgi:uroporphyrinogen-III synthase